MVKFSTSFFVAAFIAAPAFASINWDQIDARELSDYELFGRELTEAEATLFARDYDELFTRHPDGPELDAREYEDINARDSKAARFFKGLFNVGKTIFKGVVGREDGEDVFAREYDEVDARELDALYQRYAEELEARAPIVVKHDLREGPSERDFVDDVLAERDLDLDFVERDFDEDLYQREYVEDLYERDDELDLVERELFDLQERSFNDLD